MSINMKPGIDWTKEHTALCSNSGVMHYPVEQEKLSENFVTVQQQYSGGGFCIVDCGEYLSIKGFVTKGSFYRVGDYKRDVKEGKPLGLEPHLGWFYYHGTERNIIRDCDSEIRIYKNRKFVILHKVAIGTKEIIYVNKDPNGWWHGVAWGDTESHAVTIRNLHDPNIHVVSSDAEAEALADTLPLKNLGKMKGNVVCKFWSDLRHRRIYEYNSYDVGHFHKDTQDIVENFFGYNNSENSYIRSEHARKLGYRQQSVNPGITTLRGMFTWIAVRSAAPKQGVAKEEKAAYLLEDFAEEWNNPDKYQNQVFWGRKGDEVILVLPKVAGMSAYGFGRGCKKIFAYNVKTKTRFYGELDHNGSWTFPIPGLSYITSAICLENRRGNPHSYYGGSDGNELTEIKTIIKGGISVRELFDKTNIAWILDNAGPDCLVNYSKERGCGYYSRDSHSDKAPVNIKEFLTEKYIGTIALSILITTGIPMLEQLLKSNLFNMYFTAIDDLGNRSNGNTEIFYDCDKKRADDYGKKYASFTYHGKEKNLKKMFGLSLNAIREIDKSMAFTFGVHPGSYQKTSEWYRPLPRMGGICECIGSDLTNLDMETFSRCLELSIGKVGNRSYYTRDSVWGIIGDNLHLACGPNTPPKQIVSLLETYRNCIEEYRDYLSMRIKLKQIQDVKPDIPDIFSEKRYPIKPGAAKRFIPFLEGMPDRRYSWRRENYTEETFVAQYKEIFPDAKNRGDLQIIKEDNGHLLGILVSLTAEENLKYLHDDASYWISFYEDSAKDELFKQATGRVKDLQWVDDESGLQIVMPTCVAELKNEGSVLSHCVASYVDPIINGKENIMFLRRTDMPDDPFYTVEVLEDGEIRQVHCYRNGDLTAEGQQTAFASSNYQVYDHTYDIVGFLLKWSKAMKGKVKATSVKSRYGALCALR